MKIHNLTDTPTAALAHQGLVRTHVRVGDVVIAPGSEADIPETPGNIAEVRTWEGRGALGYGDHPKTIEKARLDQERVVAEAAAPVTPPEPAFAAEEERPQKARRERA